MNVDTVASSTTAPFLGLFALVASSSVVAGNVLGGIILWLELEDERKWVNER